MLFVCKLNVVMYLFKLFDGAFHYFRDPNFMRLNIFLERRRAIAMVFMEFSLGYLT